MRRLNQDCAGTYAFFLLDVSVNEFTIGDSSLAFHCQGSQPPVESRRVTRSDFRELDAHTPVRLGMNDPADPIQFLLLMDNMESQDRSVGHRIERVDIAALTAQVARSGFRARVCV